MCTNGIDVDLPYTNRSSNIAHHVREASVGVFCKHCFLTQHSPAAGSLAGAGSSVAHLVVPASTSISPLYDQASCNSPAFTATTKAAAADTPTQGPADFVLTAPDTQGNQQVMERIHLTSPSKMLAADAITWPPASYSPAARLHVPGQVSTSSGHNSVAGTLQLTRAPAVYGPPDALHDSFASADAWNCAPATGLLGMKCAEAHIDLADWPGEQAPAGSPVSRAHVEQHGSMGNAGMTWH